MNPSKDQKSARESIVADVSIFGNYGLKKNDHCCLRYINSNDINEIEKKKKNVK